MAEEIPAGDRIYVELGEASTPTINLFVKVIQNLQRELPYIMDSKQRLWHASKEKERMIKILTEKSSQKIVEAKMMKGGKSEPEKSESEGELDKTYFRKSK